MATRTLAGHYQRKLEVTPTKGVRLERCLHSTRCDLVAPQWHASRAVGSILQNTLPVQHSMVCTIPQGNSKKPHFVGW
jgi:hypothetical protein